MENFNGKPLNEYFLSQLEAIRDSLDAAEAKRNEANKHHKFDKVNNKKAIDFPSPNPEFLKLKEAINNEIEMRKKNA